ncbi:phenylalanine ammonia-lyase [Meredithblackwellia eburnea MCA 4105]
MPSATLSQSLAPTHGRLLTSVHSDDDDDQPGSQSPRPPSPAAATHQQQQLNITRELLQDSDRHVNLTGHALTLGSIVAAARHRKTADIDLTAGIKETIDESVAFLKSKLGTSIYGVTTGFGGSADTRTDKPLALQLALLEHQLCGVTPTSYDQLSVGRGLENTMPEEVVRGAMLIRVNSLARGHSAVRLSVLQTLIRFLDEGITPVVPLRGSISASGDLSPLSYIAGAITGHPDIRVITRKRGQFEVMTAPEALELHGIEKVVMGPKEGLGLVNGTAVSASMATMALHDTHFLALWSQALTALSVEAMVGHVGSFHPFIHDVTRPHPGQIEVARNIRTVLQGSSFAVQFDKEVGLKEDEGVLRQDRYPLRTSAQWIGPLLSDLVGSSEILRIEVNSTTDNPLVDVQGGIVHSGGNFQAMAVTNAMEKTRLGIAQMGKLSFAQMTELVNCTMNRGLPSCLAAEDPSTSYHVKGLDIAAASYTSELGFLANPVSTHVQPAEMSNQAVNSLALISARKTVEANEVLSFLMATHLYCAAQALDLRYIEFAFRAKFNPTIVTFLEKHFSPFLSAAEISTLAVTVQNTIWRRLETTTSVDLEPRWADAFAHTASVVLDALAHTTSSGTTGGNNNPLAALALWRTESCNYAIQTTRDVRQTFFATVDRGEPSPTVQYLGNGTKSLYSFVRDTLGVKPRRGDVFLGVQEKTIGRSVSTIVESFKDGSMHRVLAGMF